MEKTQDKKSAPEYQTQPGSNEKTTNYKPSSHAHKTFEKTSEDLGWEQSHSKIL